MSNINTGSVQAPYLQRVIKLKPFEIYKDNYVFNNFRLLGVSRPEILEIVLGGAVVQTKFNAGMGYKSADIIPFIELHNTSDEELTIEYALAVGDIDDSRLTVSGIVDVRAIETVETTDKGFSALNAGTRTAPATTSLKSGQTLSIICTSGTITVNSTFGIKDLELSSGQSFEVKLNTAGDVAVTGSGKFNFLIGE